MKPDWKRLIPVFILGTLLGAALGAWAHRTGFHHLMRKGPAPERMLARFDKELDLDEKQEQALKTLLESRREEMKIFREETRKRFEAIRTAMHADIKKLLSPEQQARFDSMASRSRSHHKQRWGKE